MKKSALLEKSFVVERLSDEETEELLNMFSEYVTSSKSLKFKRD